MKEGKDIINYMMGVQGIAICMGNGIQCLNITFQVWLPVVNTSQDHHKCYMLHACSFRGQEINTTSSISLLPVRFESPTRSLTGYIGNNVRMRTWCGKSFCMCVVFIG